MAERLEQFADEGGVGITPHATANRARTRGRECEAHGDEVQAPAARTNQTFRAARLVDPSLRYEAFMEARKAALLELLARRGEA